ncbi:allophanate hydrolase [Aliiruegeria haliotis]|uniref:Allophanate hydrolase n=1 Tax=Aliiruegeria haliotis TaxID=1280846 RepID=A0A2T0RTG0_9RHOB|nr:biotin-dependent carboxyltransferase family protein [Aliiruegeria haliotis]PRY24451.1 allophanate hydrolase [Aliiruegeria haliotis]
MTGDLIVHRAGPGITVQDLGREGCLAHGLSRGGAADPSALAQGAALLNQAPSLAALEIAGAGMEVSATRATWIALTGAPMRAHLADKRLIWNASHCLPPGERLRLGPMESGHYAYLHVAGGIDVPMVVGGRGTHLASGIGAALEDGATLPVGKDPLPDRNPSRLPDDPRFDGGRIRFLEGPQTRLFPDDVLARFLATEFTRTAWGNRQGVKLGQDGDGFRPQDGLNLLSEVISPGDIQITGDGTPYVLGPECQTIGGYPRIGTVLPQDLPRVMQATSGAPLRFDLVTLEEALSDYSTPKNLVPGFRRRITPLVRNPHDIVDLLSYNFISGVTAGRDLDEEEPRA